MHRKPLFWIGLLLLVALSCFFVYRYGNRVFFFDLDITMSAKSSKTAADSLAKALNLQLDGYKNSAAFLSDDTFQNYVELKCGGRKTFTKVLDSGVYHPLYWYVRLFKPGETRELAAYYTPTGKLISFQEKVPEAEIGAALERSEAQTIAETEAANRWKVDLTPYKLVEAKADTKPNKRIDHTFVYERTDAKIGEALYRLRLTVSGNKLTELYHFAKVPDKFNKEFEEMRSYNETLAEVASGIMQLVYIIGLIIWFIILIRQKKLIFAPPLRWGIVIAIFMILGSLNFLSFFWLDYDTSSSAGGFLAEQLVQVFISALFMGALAWFTILVAEALTREAFPNQVQFWRLADKDVASTKDVLSKVLVGYLLFPIQLAYVVGFYGFMGSRFGWWAPSGVMSDPNILSTFSPFISAIGNALQPGFWEEALFRALPLATCAILGRKYNKRGLFLAIGMIIQVLVFSAAHANYPQQPFYFRLVELIVPSLLFAFAYIYFGLVTGVILHFTFDAVLMNLSALLSTAPGMNLDRTLFFVFLLVPLWVVLIQKIRSNKPKKGYNPIWKVYFSGWGEVPESKLNKAWTALTVTDEQPETPQPVDTEPVSETPEPTKGTPVNPFVIKLARYLFAFMMALMLATTSPFSEDVAKVTINGATYTKTLEAPRLEISSKQAKEIATQELKRILTETGKEFPAKHKAYAQAYRSKQDEIYLVLNKPTEHSIYLQLKDKYFFTEGWEIQFKRLKGTLDQRSENYSIFLTTKGKFLSYVHELPEDRAGANLSETEARAIVQHAILTQYRMRFVNLKEISVSPSKLPKRTDWTFTFEDSLKYGLTEGSARMDINIRGDELAGIKFYVFIPESKQRQFDKESQLASVVKFAGAFTTIGFIVFAAVFCILRFSRKQIDMGIFLSVFLVLAGLYIAKFITTWDAMEGSWFNPIEPYNNQLITMVISFLVGLIFQNGFIAALAGSAFWQIEGKRSSNLSIFTALIVVIIGNVGVNVLSSLFVNVAYLRTPDWVYAFGDIAFGAILYKISSTFWMYLGLAAILFQLFDRFTRNFTKRYYWPIILSLLVGLVMATRLGIFYWNPLQLQTLAAYTAYLAAMIFFSYYYYHKSNKKQLIIYSLILFTGFIVTKADYPAFKGQIIGYPLAYLVFLIIMLLFFWINSRKIGKTSKSNHD